VDGVDGVDLRSVFFLYCPFTRENMEITSTPSTPSTNQRKPTPRGIAAYRSYSATSAVRFSLVRSASGKTPMQFAEAVNDFETLRVN